MSDDLSEGEIRKLLQDRKRLQAIAFSVHGIPPDSPAFERYLRIEAQKKESGFHDTSDAIAAQQLLEHIETVNAFTATGYKDVRLLAL
jgi:hypothetical protein